VSPSATIRVSSAYPTVIVPLGIGRLNTVSYAMFHRRGPSTEPCGTPQVVSMVLEPPLASSHTCRTRPPRYESRIRRRYVGKPIRSSATRIVVHPTVLNAFRMSRPTATATRRALRASSGLPDTTRNASSVDRPFRKPYCLWDSPIPVRAKLYQMLGRHLKRYPSNISFCSRDDEIASARRWRGFVLFYTIIRVDNFGESFDRSNK